MNRAEATTVRNWARSNGFTTSARGPLSAKVVDAYAAAHVGPASTPPVKAVAKKPSAAKKNATTRKVAATTAPGKKAPAKKPATKKTTTSAPARKASAAGPASKGATTKVPSTRRSTTAAAPAGPVPVTSTGPEPHAAAAESAPLNRLIALEKQVADLTSRLVAVESGNREAGSNAAATVAKPTRMIDRRH